MSKVKSQTSNGLVSHGHGAGSGFPAAEEPEVDVLREAGEQGLAVAGEPGVHDELVLVDQAQFRQRERERDAAHEQALARLLLELPNGVGQVAPQELGVPIDLLERV